MAKYFLLLSSISGLVAVALGAFGAHGLKQYLDESLLKIFHTGVEYQFYHTFALAIVGTLLMKEEQALLKWSGYAFSFGIVVFSGSLYILALTKVKAWGAVTPIGGLSFMIGWALLARAVTKIL